MLILLKIFCFRYLLIYAISMIARRLDDRYIYLKMNIEESPGSTEARCRVIPGGGDPRESATERKPPIRQGKGERVR